MREDHSPRETIGGASGGGGALFSTTKPGTDVGMTPAYKHTRIQWAVDERAALGPPQH